MGLNIKDKEVHDLAREVAAQTGTNMTAAVRDDLNEKLVRLRRARDPEAVVARVKRSSKSAGHHRPASRAITAIFMTRWACRSDIGCSAHLPILLMSQKQPI